MRPGGDMLALRAQPRDPRLQGVAEKVMAGELVDLPMTLAVAREAVSLPSTPVTVELCEQATGRCVAEQTTFFGPTR